jgi:SpoVK/Ycf46/Vps4 family AAA+-type ATPase
MEEIKEYSERVFHLARLALAGRPQDVQMCIRRLARWLRTVDPAAAAKLEELLTQSPTRQAPMRSESMSAVPVDPDTRLQLARTEYPVTLDAQPIWPDETGDCLRQLVSERRREADLERAGISPTRTVLLTGAPGLGKTLAARWVAHELDRPLLTLDLSAVMSSFLGRTGNNVRHVLDYAKGMNCILLLDEFDAVAKRRDDTGEIGELKRLVAVLLQEVDDWPATGLLMAATNHPGLLDPAVWRRFEMVVQFPQPTDQQVRQAIDLFLGKEIVPDQAKDVAALCLKGLSFSDIEREINRIRRDAVLTDQSAEARLLVAVRGRTKNLSLPDRKAIAVALTQQGFTQHEVSRWTGLARETIRTATQQAQPTNTEEN